MPGTLRLIKFSTGSKMKACDAGHNARHSAVKCPEWTMVILGFSALHFGLFSYFSQVIWGFSATPNAHFGLFAHFITQHEKMHPTVRQKWLLDSKINANVQQR
jgi:hypothetical protein